MHTVMELVRGEMPVHDSSPGDFGGKVRAYVRRRAEIEGKGLTGRQVDELTKSLLDYRREIVEGLGALNHIGLRGQWSLFMVLVFLALRRLRSWPFVLARLSCV